MKNKFDIKDEEIFLLGLCRLSFGAELRVMLLALAETINDWSYFTELANKHGVEALVYHNLQTLDFLKYVPPEQASRLHNALMVNVSRNTSKIRSLAGVMKLLDKWNIRTVMLKGMALELMVYGNCGLRQMTDVDVLTTREESARAREILMKNGFKSYPVKSFLHIPILADIGKHLPTLEKDGFAIEFHHELFGIKKHLLTGLLFDTGTLFDTDLVRVFLPQPQIFFLYLVRHLHLHERNNESQLRLYADLVVMIEKYRDEIINIDLLSHALKARMGDILAWKLEPLRDLWGISFPDWLNSYIDKWYDPASVNKFIFFLKSPKGNPLPDRAKTYRRTVKEIPGIHRKILFILGDLFPTITFMKRRYNCRNYLQAFFHYPLRLGKLWYLIKF
ncbi:MAG TPA: nucleotidyltransferase family protein [Bacteroidales bacterium]|nr:nucleotidyltransferase family protein [Bacteroidales bacterium]HPF03935.1 nucleotidyltransferase family protein [Bacteroidales bacterium]HPJ60277.1 nucleotidyltransferase family protein [Bacteroidales bacterium]HPR11885.1 nucleotidyltransferase family protein [Bacteroidales bacterium]HRW83966.1 nucleotidyltransferase family protein [Bacteroidales bacterium]